MMEPREIGDQGHERVFERVAAIDVAEASGMVCVRVPHEPKPGRRVSGVWEVPAATRAVTGLGDHLVCQGIEKVTVESASG
jgi:transposase